MQRFPDNILTGKPYGFALGMPCGWCQGPPALLEDRAPSGGAKAHAAPTYLKTQPQQINLACSQGDAVSLTTSRHCKDMENAMRVVRAPNADGAPATAPMLELTRGPRFETGPQY